MRFSLHTLTFILTITLLAGCSASKPFRTSLVEAGSVECPPRQAENLSQCASITPEVAKDTYELHFVEFDDQGWAYSKPEGGVSTPAGSDWNQINHLMSRLTALLSKGEDLNIILYIHGWMHNASTGDRDVNRFRELLYSASRLERSRSDTTPASKQRKVIGIYVGWRGKSWDLPDYLLNTTFWSRKAAALRISHGSVQELFSRLRTVQQHYNGPEHSPNCATQKARDKTSQSCKIRTLMVGHSFGAWILYSAVSGPLIEVLNSYRDRPAGPGRSPEVDKADLERVERLADLIVLINPAFEAVRYEPLHQAAMAYKPQTIEPPLLVSVTTSADQATRTFFPVGRVFNTFFENPTTSEKQSIAMLRTHGHIESYWTHRLVDVDDEPCVGWKPPGQLTSDDADAMKRNKAVEELNSANFFKTWRDPSSGLLKEGWKRNFCGKALLTQLQTENTENKNPNSLVWNIRTNYEIMSGHSEILGREFLEFVRQLYDDSALRIGP